METLSLEQLELIAPTSYSLNKASVEVGEAAISSPIIQGLVTRMFTLSAGKGHSEEDTRQMVGLAAGQLGANQRIITIDLTADGSNQEQHLQEIINPTITSYLKETIEGREGCWSCGNICGIVERSKEVTLEGLDRDGRSLKLKLIGFVARIAQHEVDHLDGIRFPDRIPEDKPERLHWVEVAEFDNYRKNWAHWPIRCPRERWNTMKTEGSI